MTDPLPTTDEVFSRLDAACEAGRLRRLDVALARFICGQAPTGASPLLAVATALLAQHEAQGHSCWPLAEGLQALAAPRAPTADEAPDDEPAVDALDAPAWLPRLPAEAAVWRGALRASGVVDDAGRALFGNAPLVLDGDRLYLRRYWQHEQQLVAAVRDRVRGDRAHQVLDPPSLRIWLDRLFGPPDPAAVDWQRVACAMALRARLTVVTGGPGTGKTYTAARALALLFASSPQPLRVALAAPTGKAAARLGQAIDMAWAGLASQAAQLPDVAAALRQWGAQIGPARTLHALLGARPMSRAWRHDARHPLALDVLVVDEASMVHLELMSALLAALPPQARLVLLGDKDQLASVEAGAVLGDLCAGAETPRYWPATAEALAALTGQTVPAAFLSDGPGDGSALAQQTVMLRHSRRFGGPIGALARAVNDNDRDAAWRQLLAGDASVCLLEPAGQAGLPFDDEAAQRPLLGSSQGPLQGSLQERLLARVLDGAGPHAVAGGLRAVQALVQRGPQGRGAEAHAAWVREVLRGFDGGRVLAALRQGPWGVEGLNSLVETALRDAGLLPASATAAGGWYAGRPVIVTRNDPAAGVHNGDIGMALPGADSGGLRVWFLNGEVLHSVRPGRLMAVETAFAMTVHKSQGSEFGHTVLVLPPRPSPVLTRELLYTGITRAREALTLVLPARAVFDAALALRTQRASGLGQALRP